MNRQRFTYYNRLTRSMMLFVLIPMFLILTALFVSTQNSFLLMIAFFFFVLLGVFVYKACFMHVIIDSKGVKYQSLFKQKFIAKEDLLDVLVVQRQRRNEPLYRNFKDFYDSSSNPAGSFVIFRLANEFPKSNAFVFSDPIDSYYITIQYRRELDPIIFDLLGTAK